MTLVDLTIAKETTQSSTPMKLVRKRRVYNLSATTKAVTGRITATMPMITEPLSSIRESHMSPFGSAEFILIRMHSILEEEEAFLVAA